MSGITEKIIKVAKFADPKHGTYSAVQFTQGTVKASGPEGGASAATGLDLEAVVSAVSLTNACRALPEAELSVVDKSGTKRLRLAQGNSKAHLECLSPNMAVQMPLPPKAAKWAAVEGLERLDKAAWCTSQDAARPHLHGVHLSGLGMSATNGAAAVRVSLGGEVTEAFGDGACYPVSMLRDLAAVVPVATTQRQAFFAPDPTGGEYRAVKAYDVRFPPLDHLFESVQRLPAMRIQKQELIGILKSAKLSDERVVLEVVGSGLRVKVHTVGGGLSLFDYEAFVEFDGQVPEGIAGFSIGLLLPAIQSAPSPELTVYFNPKAKGSFDPLGIVSEGYQALVMPTRL